jgi:hypothetical protein
VQAACRGSGSTGGRHGVREPVLAEIYVSPRLAERLAKANGTSSGAGRAVLRLVSNPPPEPDELRPPASSERRPRLPQGRVTPGDIRRLVVGLLARLVE